MSWRSRYSVEVSIRARVCAVLSALFLTFLSALPNSADSVVARVVVVPLSWCIATRRTVNWWGPFISQSSKRGSRKFALTA